MTWGTCFMYYHCPQCGKRYKFGIDMIPVFGQDFGRCPVCGEEGTFEKDGARTPDDALYEEVE
jgi:diphthamide biosynthesis protein 3